MITSPSSLCKKQPTIYILSCLIFINLYCTALHEHTIVYSAQSLMNDVCGFQYFTFVNNFKMSRLVHILFPVGGSISSWYFLIIALSYFYKFSKVQFSSKNMFVVLMEIYQTPLNSGCTILYSDKQNPIGTVYCYLKIFVKLLLK